MNQTIEDQLKMNSELKHQISIEKTVQIEQMREIKKFYTEN